MLKAFNMHDLFEDSWNINQTEDGLPIDDDMMILQEDTEEISFNVIEDHENWETISISSESDEDVILFDAASENDDSAGEPFQCRKQLSCLAHSLQLVINKALKDDTEAMQFVAYVEKLVTFFRKRVYWQGELLKACDNQSLIKPVHTRWNSFFYALERLAKVKKKLD